MRLFALIESTFGKKIPLAALFKAPTIEQLAEVLRADGSLKQWSSLVPIRPSGSLPPLFCVHGHFGEILFYRPLARCLGPEQPFFALQAQVQQDLPAHDTIEAMAADYIAQIRRVRPRGPYSIGGFCLGALVAFEMAQQQDETVAFLGLFVGYVPKLGFFTHWSDRFGAHLRGLRLMGPRAKLAEITKNLTRKVQSLLWRATYNLFGRILPRSSSLFRNVPEMNLQAAKRYVPRTYPGRMTVFLSGAIPAGFSLDPKLVLDGMDAREIDLRIVPGDRDSMLQDPFVSVLAEGLKACLSSAPARGSSDNKLSRELDPVHHG